MAEESIWRKLTRLFRSGPVVRHKVARAEPSQAPLGTASAFKRELSSIYVRALSSFASYERISRSADYNEMEFTPELASALDIYADETTCENDDKHVITIHSKNAEIKEVLEELFYDVLDIDFNAWSWVRHMCKFGDLFLMVDATEENGILQMFPIPVNEIEREEGFDKEDPYAVRFRWLTRGNMIMQNWQVVHFRLLGNESYLPYGCAILEPARRIWRQLILIEDAMLVYRIVRSPERRVFNIEVGNTPPQEVPRYMEQIKNELRRNVIVDPATGRVDLRYNPLSVDEDYFLPKRGQNTSTIDTLTGGQFTGDIEDVTYIQNKMFAAIKIPKAYLGYEGELGSKATLAQEDVRFAKTIQRIQKLFAAELHKIAIIHLYLLGYRAQDLVNFEITMASPSTIAEQQKLELWRMRLEVAGMSQEGILDKRTIWKRIFDMNDREIAKVIEGMKLDKLDQQSIDAAGQPTDTEPEGEEEPAAGSEDLPDTLGGPEGGPTGGTPEPPPENASVEPEDIVTDAKNPGSTGSRAEIAVDKGKDLFSTGEDQRQLAFGTKKQTASDPFDRRAMRRTVTRPFSEDSGPDDAVERALDAWIREVESSRVS